MNGVFFYTALYLQRTLGFSPTEAGLVFLPLAAVLLVAAPVAERLSASVGTHRVISVGLAMVAAGLVCISATGATAS
ncbi:hypothetical protein ACH492_39580 [Streptomyces sp. NPDC019443]|uniref:hypothetical protein n=1 Tax=Streptomyces sp. NPDC019443 TaxID=3365061 RepID=UPI0037B4B0F2